MLDIHGLLMSLAENRKIFHSEADFQHALAWMIHQAIPETQVRLEVNPFPNGDRRMFLDIWMPVEGIAIELKYVTRRLELDQDGEWFSLRNHRAQDQRRYDFLSDVQRLEFSLANLDGCKSGHALLLTNDPLHWNAPSRPDTVDAAFQLHEGRLVSGELNWSDSASEGTRRGRESPINLESRYRLHWEDYSQLNADRYAEFRYLAIAVE